MAFNIYKPGLGKYTRLYSAIGLSVLAGLGCWRLYGILADVSWFGLSKETALLISRLVPAALFAILAFLIYLLLNKPAVADFLIASEGEMKKVNWSSRKEIVVSTFIVIVVVLILAALIGLTDFIFTIFFAAILRGS
jgi:preprotein translocase subunit SecE